MNNAIPTHAEIKQARKRYGVDRARAAWMINASEADWNNWESGLLSIPVGTWKVCMLKTNLDEYKRLQNG